ncbi:unnamed protein product [Arabidopsis arenosa]|uniref:DUF4283 domain-containing protein n=1 Tax=Arabidopsis arenosa TaxID=38785 RepID=A0A8S1ZW56_ARAAE|nr:unnamed protein product [Arabidopsis arenosa]
MKIINFWVQIKGIPLLYLASDMAMYLGNQIGSVKEVEFDENTNMVEFVWDPPNDPPNDDDNLGNGGGKDAQASHVNADSLQTIDPFDAIHGLAMNRDKYVSPIPHNVTPNRRSTSNARTSRERPKWIGTTIWKTMTDYWDTEEAHARSLTYSNVRMSDRNGLGPHIHFSGPKSYQQIQEEMEEEVGRRVILGENVQERLSELEAEAKADTSAVSDGASRPRELTTEDYLAIFLKSTKRDSRGNPYGVGNLKDCMVNGKRKQPDESFSFVPLQVQLKEAQRKIEEQAAREAEQSQAVAEQKDRLEQLSLVEKYLRETDPHFLDFMASQSAKEPT